MKMKDAGTSVVHAPEDADHVELTEAGTGAAGEFRCAECGYGAVVHGRLPTCPMCGGTSWERAPWSPFSRGSSGSTDS